MALPIQPLFMAALRRTERVVRTAVHGQHVGVKAAVHHHRPPSASYPGAMKAHVQSPALSGHHYHHDSTNNVCAVGSSRRSVGHGLRQDCSGTWVTGTVEVRGSRAEMGL